MIKERYASPLQSIHSYCCWCANGQDLEIRLCSSKNCPLHNLRFGVKLTKENTIDAIKRKCKDCAGKQCLVAKCEYVDC